MTDMLKDYTPFQIGWIGSFLVFFMNLGVLSAVSKS